MDIGDSIELWLKLTAPPEEPHAECERCEGSGVVDCDVQFPGELAITRILVDCPGGEP